MPLSMALQSCGAEIDMAAIWHEQKCLNATEMRYGMSSASGYRYVLGMCLPIGSAENERELSALNRLLDQFRNRMKPKHTNVVVHLNGQKDRMLADYSPQVLEFLRRVLRPDVHMEGTAEGNGVQMEETV